MPHQLLTLPHGMFLVDLYVYLVGSYEVEMEVGRNAEDPFELIQRRLAEI